MSGQYIDDEVNNTTLKTSTLAVWAVKGMSGGAVTLQATGYYIPYTPGDDGTIAAGVALPTTRMIDNGNGLTSADTGLNSVSAVFTNFVSLQYYWTSTTQAGNTGNAWTVFSCDWGAFATAKSATGHTLAVRGP